LITKPNAGVVAVLGTRARRPWVSIVIFNGQVTFGLMTDVGRMLSLLNEEFSRERYGI
jgi:hypothetical protein